MKTTNVAAGVLINDRDEFLLATRPEGKAYAGWWEFPGGKIEAGETPREAAIREIAEELGVTVGTAYPWLTETFVYPHTTVRLQFFQVTSWTGDLHPHEGQIFSWHKMGTLEVEQILPANLPILKSLALPRFFAITCAHELGEEQQLQCLERRLSDGLRLVQIREKGWPVDRLRAFAEQVLLRARQYGALVYLNDEAALAQELGCGVHYSSDRLMALNEAPFLPAGASCHTVDEVRHAEKLGLDYALVGPVQATATHPGAVTLGWDGLAKLLEHGYSIPVYALGGLSRSDLGSARIAGAHGVAMMRAAWHEPV